MSKSFDDMRERFRRQVGEGVERLEDAVKKDPRADKAFSEAKQYGGQAAEQAKGYLSQAKVAIGNRIESIPGYTPEAGKNAKRVGIAAVVGLGALYTPVAWFLPSIVETIIAGSAMIYGGLKARDTIRSIDSSPDAKYKAGMHRR